MPISTVTPVCSPPLPSAILTSLSPLSYLPSILLPSPSLLPAPLILLTTSLPI
ncbi:unnamed protein product [Meloidogyne enterolobii]|uniref:Uncharacterized protein n=1 Tax=Meloidogyne enterolobii TaxID=390850 RepID=A0ACB1AP40_MELEN